MFNDDDGGIDRGNIDCKQQLFLVKKTVFKNKPSKIGLTWGHFSDGDD